ncbi:MAG: bifunctional phosphoribosylaminoimidazolecarboxamide formyltransferase/IMP cyclohydrolase [bacterium]
MFKISRALISCTDKTGLDTFGKFLADRGVEILSTGGTAKVLKAAGVRVVEVSDYTGSPEILDGRLKTLHPKIHGGILGIRNNEKHQSQMAENDIKPIDLLIVNLYAFEKTISDPSVTLQDAIENIDIGGPTMLRAAAKNYEDVAIICDPNDYNAVRQELEEHGTLSRTFRFELARKVFNQTAKYDTAIAAYLNKIAASKEAEKHEPVMPEDLTLSFKKVAGLRYGENPQQQAALYTEEDAHEGIIQAMQLQGKELSFNNIMDMEAAWKCCQEFNEPTCVIVKHMNPCGVAMSEKLSDCYLKARAGDPVSCFGGIVAFNRSVDLATARLMAETFFEVVIAPGYEEEALAIFAKKKNLRLMSHKGFATKSKALDYRRVTGGLLVQENDADIKDVMQCLVATKKQPSPQEMADLNFAWKVVKHVKSNAIVFAKDKQIIGVGAGQMSRVDSVKIAARKAKESFEKDEILHNAVMASDAFFPFRDGVELAFSYGIKAVVQPGGSMRDKEVIEACDEQDVSMVFTGMRHFKH